MPTRCGVDAWRRYELDMERQWLEFVLASEIDDFAPAIGHLLARAWCIAALVRGEPLPGSLAPFMELHEPWFDLMAKGPLGRALVRGSVGRGPNLATWLTSVPALPTHAREVPYRSADHPVAVVVTTRRRVVGAAVAKLTSFGAEFAVPFALAGATRSDTGTLLLPEADGRGKPRLPPPARQLEIRIHGLDLDGKYHSALEFLRPLFPRREKGRS